MGIKCVTLHTIAVFTLFELLMLKQNRAENFTLIFVGDILNFYSNL